MKKIAASLSVVLALAGMSGPVVAAESKPNETAAVTVSGERYVPDDVRAKYNLPATDIQDVSPVAAPTPLMASDNVLHIVPTAPETPQKPVISTANEPIVGTWRARKGERVQDVLARWSARQSVNLSWDSTTSPVLSEDFSFIGRFDRAVAMLLRDTSGNRLQSRVSDEMQPQK